MKKAYRIPLLALILVCLLLSAAFPAALAAPSDCSLTLSYTPDGAPLAGATFRVYRVARVNQAQMTFTAVSPYSGYHVLGNTSVSWLERAETLRGYVLRDELAPTAEAVTNAEGVAVFPQLETGLYLILGGRAQRDGFFYDPVPFFLSLPNSYDKGETWVRDVTSSVKFERFEVPKDPVQRHVKKVWENDAGHEEARPEAITVELLRDGAVYDTVELNAGNNWRWDWTSLDPNSEWRLVEQDPGGNYQPSVTQVGITFLVTNTYAPPTPPPVRPSPSPSPSPSDEPSPSPGGEDPTDPTDPTPSVPPEEEDFNEPDIPLGDLVIPDDPTGPEEDLPDGDTPTTRLPQTGQLWWPVPILAIVGMFLLLSGLIRRKRSEVRDDET